MSAAASSATGRGGGAITKEREEVAIPSVASVRRMGGRVRRVGVAVHHARLRCPYHSGKVRSSLRPRGRALWVNVPNVGGDDYALEYEQVVDALGVGLGRAVPVLVSDATFPGLSHVPAQAFGALFG